MSTRETALQQLSEYLGELVADRREERARRVEAESERQKGRSAWPSFWAWLRENVTAVSLIVTIITGILTGIWAIGRYLEQRQAETKQRQAETEQRAAAADLEKRRTIATFAVELSDPQKRNGAAYALATVSGTPAIPILAQHLQATVREASDGAFRDALVQAMIAIGPDVLDETIRLNRESVLTNDTGYFKAPGMLATQPILFHFLRVRSNSLFDKTPRLEGTVLIGGDLGSRNLDHVNLSGTRISRVNFCRTSMREAIAGDASFIDSIQLSSSNLRGIVLVNSRFDDARFEYADLTDADLSNADLGRSTLRNAKLSRARLVNTRLEEVDLDNADLSGADLDQVRIVPRERLRKGPAVWGANFAGAKGISGELRQFLCAGGALNVPGGCGGIQVGEPRPSSGSGSSCW